MAQSMFEPHLISALSDSDQEDVLDDEAITLLEQSVLLKKQIQGVPHPDTKTAVEMLSVWKSRRDEKLNS